jgi:hypothetical protein
MNTARALLVEVLVAIPDGRRVAALFADDEVVELSVGMGDRRSRRRHANSLLFLVSLW